MQILYILYVIYLCLFLGFLYCTLLIYLCHESDRFSPIWPYKNSANQEEVAFYNKSVLLFSNLSLLIFTLLSTLYVHKNILLGTSLVVQS